MIFLHLIRSLRLESGGPSQGLRSIVAGYLRDGHSAEIATLDPPDQALPEFGVLVHALGNSVFGYGRSPQLRPWLRANAKRFDGIVVHGLWQYHGLAALQELTGKYPYAVFVHGMLDPWFNRTYPMKRLKKLAYWFPVQRRILKGAHRVLFTSTLERDLAVQSFPGSVWKPSVVPYGTSGPPGGEAQAQAQRDALIARLPQLRNEKFLLYAGRIHQKKGCDLVIRAYAEVACDSRLPPLVMAGPDEVGLTPNLQAMASKAGISHRIFWPGMLTGDAKWGAFRCAEAFVLPSHQENFGIAVAEALSCGTPALISREINIHQDVLRWGAGFVEPDTLPGTISLLRRWAETNESERAIMRTQAVPCWNKSFNSECTARAIVDIFSEPRELL